MAEKPLDEDALASCKNRFWQVGNPIKKEMPTAPVLRTQIYCSRKSNARNVAVEQNKSTQLVLVLCCVRIAYPRPNVVADQKITVV